MSPYVYDKNNSNDTNISSETREFRRKQHLFQVLKGNINPEFYIWQTYPSEMCQETYPKRMGEGSSWNRKEMIKRKCSGRKNASFKGNKNIERHPMVSSGCWNRIQFLFLKLQGLRVINPSLWSQLPPSSPLLIMLRPPWPFSASDLPSSFMLLSLCSCCPPASNNSLAPTQLLPTHPHLLPSSSSERNFPNPNLSISWNSFNWTLCFFILKHSTICS